MLTELFLPSLREQVVATHSFAGGYLLAGLLPECRPSFDPNNLHFFLKVDKHGPLHLLRYVVDQTNEIPLIAIGLQHVPDQNPNELMFVGPVFSRNPSYAEKVRLYHRAYDFDPNDITLDVYVNLFTRFLNEYQEAFPIKGFVKLSENSYQTAVHERYFRFFNKRLLQQKI